MLDLPAWSPPAATPLTGMSCVAIACPCSVLLDYGRNSVTLEWGLARRATLEGLQWLGSGSSQP